MKNTKIIRDLADFQILASSLSAELAGLGEAELAALEASHPEIHLLKQLYGAYQGSSGYPAPEIEPIANSTNPGKSIEQLLVESITDGLIVIDRQWRICFINQRAMPFDHLNPGDVIGKNVWEIVPQLRGTIMESNYRQVMETRQPIHFEMKGVTRDTWYFIVAYPSELGITVYWIDYSNQKSNQAELERLLVENNRQKSLLDAVFQTDPAGLAVLIGPELRLAYYNPAYRYLTPDPGLDLIDQPFNTVWGTDPWYKYRDEIETTISTGKPFLRPQVVRIFPDGTRKVFSLQIRRLQWEAQPAALVFLWDTTERFAAEQGLREREYELRLLIDSVPALIAYVDRDLRYVRINKTYERWFGEPFKNILGCQISEFVGEAAWQVIQPYAERALAGEQVEYEYLYQHANRESRWLHVTYTPDLDMDGMVRGFVVHVTDIGERKEAEDSLREEKDTLQRILETAHEGILISDVSSATITYANRRIGEILGYTPSELVGKPGISLIDPASLASIEQQIKDRQEGRGGSYEVKFLRKDGTGVWLLASGSPIYDSQGKHTGNLGMYVDITERKQAEQALRESEQRFRVMADDTPFIIWVTDPEGKMEFVNQAYLDFFGVSLEQVQSGGWQVLVHPDDAAQYVDLFMSCLQERHPYRAEARVQQKDGQWRWIESQGLPRFSESGEYLGMAGSSLDITERKQAEKALRQSEERFRLVATNVPDIIFFQDRDLRYEWIYNPADPLEESDVIGKTDADLLPREEAEQLTVIKNKVIATGEGIKLDMQLSPGGVTRWYETIYEPMRDADGQIIGVLSYSRDITERKRVQENMLDGLARIEVQRRLLEQREQERVHIARILHDGPMQELAAVNFRLQEILDSDCPPRIAEQLRGIREAILDQTRELRSYAGELRPPILASFGLGKAIRAHIETFHEKHPEIKVHYEEEQVGGLTPDEIRLAMFRIYQEALANAVKHANATEIKVHFEKTLEQALLEIKDDGLGFNTPVDWVNLARHHHLGLVGIRERVEAIGGKLEIDSAPGQGTCLRVIAPLTLEEQGGE